MRLAVTAALEEKREKAKTHGQEEKQLMRLQKRAQKNVKEN